ncbi:hypothetical protein ACPXCG_17625 [Gordonia sp. DT218]|uniref:hypothetical protein n=1 Tax=unclassified Gordonia (in: high G+C Gram-positive bacteria) TaxID=2657482 RepID=UPI003CF64CA2
MLFRLWLRSLLCAIPVSALIAIVGTVVALEIAVATDGEPNSATEYRDAFFGGFLWGLLIFIGFCYLWIPTVALIIAVVRWAIQSRRWRRVAGLGSLPRSAERTCR